MRDVRPEFNEGVNIVPQVIANGGEEMSVLVDYLKSLGYRRIDVNAGCPFPLQTRHGRGAGLLVAPDRFEELATVMKKNNDIVFSLKMRLGMDDACQWKQCIDTINDMPLCHVVMHPRIATQQYKGEVCLSAFDEFLTACKHPVVYNGDICSVEEIKSLEERYGERLAGVMIGRGLLARPSLAQEYASESALSPGTLIMKIKQMHEGLLEHYKKVIPGEAQQLMKIRSFWDYMEPTIGRKQWKKIVKAGNMKNYLLKVNELTR
jgi:tRNA-dihydrouridine synthase